MVRVIFFFFLLLSRVVLGEAVPGTIKNGFKHFQMAKEAEDKKEGGDGAQLQIDMLEGMKDDDRDPVGIALDHRVLKRLVDELDGEERKALLESILKAYFPSPNELRNLTNSILESLDYHTLLSHLSPEDCEDKGKRACPTYYSALPLIDWINALNVPNVSDPVQKNTLLHRDHFNAFDSFDWISFFLQPHGYIGTMDLGSVPHHFDLYTLGISVGGNYSFNERFILGCGLGYSHSEVNWKKVSDTASLNTVYLQPEFSFLFSRGYLSLKALGAVNFYDVCRETLLFPDRIKEGKPSSCSVTSWDVMGSFEGGLFLPIGASFYLYPSTTLNYGAIFIQESTELLDKNAPLVIDSLNEQFCRWGFRLKLTREQYKEGFGFIIPSLSLGWNQNFSLSDGKVKFRLDGCEDPFDGDADLGNWSQLSVGVGLSLLHIRGIFVSFDYTLHTGRECTLHLGTIRAGLTW